MKNRKKRHTPEPTRQVGSVSHAAGQTLVSYKVGALPILEHMMERAGLAELLRPFVFEDKRCKISPVNGLLVLLKNYIMSREPLYGVSEWAGRCMPAQLGLDLDQVGSINDDRVGRCLDRLFEADSAGFVLAVTRHVIKEFGLDLSEIHNDSTTITFSGAYEGAGQESTHRGKRTPAITWGYNKDHCPDLKQVLYNLTVCSDGAVPVAFGIENGNVTDDQTHRDTWDLLRRIVGNPDFLYVADSKLATHANMSYIANRSGRFLSVLPQSRTESRTFRDRLERGEDVGWEFLLERALEDRDEPERISVSRREEITTEGYRLLWFHSTLKRELDARARNNKIARGKMELSSLYLSMQSARSRYHDKVKLEARIEKILSETGTKDWIYVRIKERESETFVQEKAGRPGPETRYRKDVKIRYELSYDTIEENVEQAKRADGIFPLVTNVQDLAAKELYLTYKRQSYIEKRFAQLKTQFVVAPVFLKSARRIVALLTLYYLALLVQALVERELRLGMQRHAVSSLPLYPEDRDCKRPTTRRIIDLFDNVEHHELAKAATGKPVRFATELTDLQRQVLQLLGVPESTYEA